MQRIFLFFATFCVCIATTFAQDVITLKNGEDIQALVQEIGELDVKYKKFENPNGPNYTLKKSKIFRIRYANGSKDVFEDNTTPITVPTPAPITEHPSIQNNKGEIYIGTFQVLKYHSNQETVNAEDLFYDMPEALKNYNSGKTLITVGQIFAGGCALTGLYILLADNYNALLPYTGGGMLIVGVISSFVGSSKIKSAVNIYNASVRRQQTSDISLNFGITQSGGIGFVLNF